MNRYVKLCLTVGIGAWLGAATASAQLIFGAGYVGSAQTANLYSVDPATGAGTLIGSTGLKQLSALDFNPTTGVLYGIGKTGAGFVLATINTATGASTTIGGVGTIPFQDIAFASNGTLYGLSNGGLYTINITTGATTLINSATAGFYGDGLDFGPGGVLYENTELSTAMALYSVNPATGVATLINNNTFPPAYPTTLSDIPRIVALDFFSPTNTMYATVFAGTGSGATPDLVSYLATVNLTTGVVTNIGLTVTGLDAIAIYAVPEPSSLALMGVGAGLLFWRKRRRLV